MNSELMKQRLNAAKIKCDKQLKKHEDRIEHIKQKIIKAEPVYKFAQAGTVVGIIMLFLVPAYDNDVLTYTADAMAVMGMVILVSYMAVAVYWHSCINREHNKIMHLLKTNIEYLAKIHVERIRAKDIQDG